MIGLFRRRRASPPPLLSDAQMDALYEEIFEEPVTADVLYAKLCGDRRRHPGRQREWVMDARTLYRIVRVKPTGFPGFCR